MKKFLGLVGVAMTAALAIVSPAAAQRDFRCDGTFTGAVYEDVIVPRGAACKLVDSTVVGDIRAQRGAYLQTTGTAVRGNVTGRGAQTIFVDTASRIFGRVVGNRTIQVYIYNSTVIRGIEIVRASEAVQICGTTVFKGDVSVERSGRDILIGDPLTPDCAGNYVRSGDLEVERSFTDIEFVIRGNTVRRGNLEVLRNTGPVPKFVEDNRGGNRLVCRDNGAPFAAADNTGWDRRLGQCD
jgi:hypothetical protein